MVSETLSKRGADYLGGCDDLLGDLVAQSREALLIDGTFQWFDVDRPHVKKPPKSGGEGGGLGIADRLAGPVYRPATIPQQGHRMLHASTNAKRGNRFTVDQFEPARQSLFRQPY